jgi:hypothetical protein
MIAGWSNIPIRYALILIGRDIKLNWLHEVMLIILRSIILLILEAFNFFGLWIRGYNYLIASLRDL